MKPNEVRSCVLHELTLVFSVFLPHPHSEPLLVTLPIMKLSIPEEASISILFGPVLRNPRRTSLECSRG